MVPLIFLVISTLFVATLIQSVFKLIGHKWEENGNNGRIIMNIFKWPIILFVLFILFISFGVSFIETNIN